MCHPCGALKARGVMIISPLNQGRVALVNNRREVSGSFSCRCPGRLLLGEGLPFHFARSLPVCCLFVYSDLKGVQMGV
eukprot:5661694-Pyramimonas_sp.AAC.1